jgi:hypothetical protein
MRAAAGPTAAEFADKVFGPTAAAAKTLLQDDSARIHTSAMKVDTATGNSMLSVHGFTPELRVLLPPYAPDMHRVIEHSYGTAEIMFRKWLYNNPGKHTIQQYQAAFEELYKQCTTAAIISADVAGLPELYKWIHENEGNWAPAKMR